MIVIQTWIELLIKIKYQFVALLDIKIWSKVSLCNKLKSKWQWSVHSTKTSSWRWTDFRKSEKQSQPMQLFEHTAGKAQIRRWQLHVWERQLAWWGKLATMEMGKDTSLICRRRKRLTLVEWRSLKTYPPGKHLSWVKQMETTQSLSMVVQIWHLPILKWASNGKMLFKNLMYFFCKEKSQIWWISKQSKPQLKQKRMEKISQSFST